MKIYTIVLATLILGCSNQNLDHEKSIINKLNRQYDSLLLATNTINIESAKNNLKKYNESIKIAKESMNSSDNPSYETMNFINNLKLMKREFKSAPTTKKSLIKTIQENKMQLKKLNNDINNSIFGKQELTPILDQETKLLELTIKKVNDFQASYNVSESRFDSLYQLSKTYHYNQP